MNTWKGKLSIYFTNPLVILLGFIVLAAAGESWWEGDLFLFLFTVVLVSSLVVYGIRERNKDRAVRRTGMLRLVCDECGCEMFTTAKNIFDIDCPDCGCPMEKTKEAP